MKYHGWHLDMVGVGGSNPLAPTNNLLKYNELLVRSAPNEQCQIL